MAYFYASLLYYTHFFCSQKSVYNLLITCYNLRSMKLSNPFSKQTREMWRDCQICGICDKQVDLELHHIVGRESSSPLNSCPLCKSCHDTVNHSNEERQELFAFSFANVVIKNKYKTTPDDLALLENHRYLVLDNPFLMI